MALVFAGWWIGAALILLLAPRRQRTLIGQRWIHGAFRFLARQFGRLGVLTVDTAALDALVAESPRLLVSNHPSVLDAPVIVGRLPNVCCIMKQSLLDSRYTGRGARLAGYVDNGSLTAMVRRAVEALGNGSHLLVFPEATRTSRFPVGHFTRAYALIALRARVPMQTLLVEVDSPYGSKGWPPWRRPPVMPVRVTVSCGRRFEPDADIDGVVASMQRYFEQELGARGDR